jgi:hypothetical protein
MSLAQHRRASADAGQSQKAPQPGTRTTAPSLMSLAQHRRESAVAGRPPRGAPEHRRLPDVAPVAPQGQRRRRPAAKEPAARQPAAPPPPRCHSRSTTGPALSPTDRRGACSPAVCSTAASLVPLPQHRGASGVAGPAADENGPRRRDTWPRTARDGRTPGPERRGAGHQAQNGGGQDTRPRTARDGATPGPERPATARHQAQNGPRRRDTRPRTARDGRTPGRERRRAVGGRLGGGGWASV